MSEYLPEDQDLLDELKAQSEAVTTVDDSMQLRKVIAIQVMATLRNRKSLSKFDKSTSRYSKILIAFALIQIAVALCQFLYDIETTGHGWIAVGVLVLLIITIFFILRAFDPDKILKE